MGKKGKKGKASGSGGGKKKKGGKKGKKGGGDQQMTWKEALLAYQINIKEKQMEDVRYELRALEDKNLRNKERNERLKMEQSIHIRNMLKQSEEFEKKLNDEKVIEKEDVTTQMMENWEAARQEERSVADLKEKIARKESEIVRVQKEVQYWTEYMKKGQNDHKMQISLLDQELVDMQHSFDEMAGHLERTLDQAKSEIGKYTDSTLGNQKHLAAEKAMAKMNKYSRQEVLDNDWLQREVDIHKGEVTELLGEVEILEKDNLHVMSELFECHVDDLKISRNFFLTQFNDDENLDNTGILEIDLEKVKLDHKPPSSRPKSAMHRAIEQKVFGEEDEEEEEDDIEEYEGDDDDADSDFDGKNGTESGEDDPFNNYFHFDDEDFDDYLKLGPLELKLLNISGASMPIHKLPIPPADELRAKDFNPDKWPVTGRMIQSVITPRQ